MNLIGKPKLNKLLEESNETKTWIKVWISEITRMSWKSDDDVQVHYPRAIKLDKSLFYFIPNKSESVIEVSFAYLQGVALVKAVRKVE